MKIGFSFYTISTFLNLVICVFSLYGAYHNFVQRRISRYGADAFLVFIIGLFDQQQANLITTSHQLILRMGIILLLLGVGALFALIF